MNAIENQRTIILKEPNGSIAISGNLSMREKKVYNMFLETAEESLKRNPQQHIFSVALAKFKDNDYEKIIKRLSDVRLEYKILEKNSRINGFASLLDNIEIKTYTTTNFVTIAYSIPEIVRQSMISKNDIYSSIDIMIIKGLQSKYSILLYEITKEYQNLKIPKMEITMEEFSTIFGIEGKYKLTPDLKKRVLDVAVNELNNNENIDFLVSYKLKKTKAKYTHIKFEIEPKPTKLKETQQWSLV